MDCEDLPIFAKELNSALASCSSSKPEEGLQDPKLAALSGLGHPDAIPSGQSDRYVSQRSALGISNIYPFGALLFFPNIFQPEDSYNFFPWGAQAPMSCISSSCLACLPSSSHPQTPQAPAGSRLKTTAPEAPDPSCHCAALAR